jgi:hypothetical protein
MFQEVVKFRGRPLVASDETNVGLPPASVVLPAAFAL